jgi:outer membrane protein TolC
MEIANAKAAYQSGKAWPNPQLQGGQEYLGADDTPVEMSIGIGQDFGFLWSQSAKVNALRTDYEAELALFEEAKLNLVAEIIILANQYSDSRILQAALDSLIEEAKEIEKTLGVRRESGDISGYEETRLQIEVRHFMQQGFELATTQQETLQELTTLTGISGSDLENLAMDVQVTVADELLDASRAIEYGLQHRGIIRAAELQRESAQSGNKAAKASQIPGVSVGVGKLSVDGNDAGSFWEAEVEIPLFTQRRAEVQRTRASLRTTEINEKAVKHQVEQQIRDAIQKRARLAGLTIVSTDELLLEAEQNIEKGVLLYLEGELSIFELVDLLASGYASQASAVALKRAAIAADVELLRVVGAEIMEINND